MTRPKKATDAHALKRLREGLNRGESAEAAAAALGVSPRTIRRRRRELLGRGRAPAKKSAPRVRPQPAPKPARKTVDRRAELEAKKLVSDDMDEIAALDFELLVLDDEELRDDLAEGLDPLTALIAHTTYGRVVDQLRTPERIAQLALWIEQQDRTGARRLLEAALAELPTTETRPR